MADVISITRDEIIQAAFEDMGIYAPGAEVPDPGEVATASKRLNMMIKAWQATGVGLWLNQIATLPLQAGAQSYLLGPSGSPCSSSMGETTLAVAAASGDSSITVDDASEISNGQYIGIQLDGGSIQWTTVNGAPSGNVVTLASTLAGPAAVGNVVFHYTTQISRPLGIVEARIRDKGGNEIVLSAISYSEYMALPLKSSTGKTTQYCYNALMGNGVLYVWPVNTTMSDRIIFTVRMPIQVFTNLDDAPDFPQEWFDALHFGLALRLCPAFGVPPQRYALIKEQAVISLSDADGFDREQETSVLFGLDMMR